MGDILYPIAVGVETGAPIHIGQARRGGAYACLYCAGAMVARQGKIKIAHFAHKPDVDADGCARTALRSLHNRVRDAIAGAAVGAIGGGVQGGFAALGAPNPPYWLKTPCGCGALAALNLRNGWAIETEVSLAPNTRADIAVSKNGYAIAVEIVDTHDVSDATKAAYLAAGVPVARIVVNSRNAHDWDAIVANYANGAIADSIASPRECADCYKRGARYDAALTAFIHKCEAGCGRVVKPRNGKLYRHCYVHRPICPDCGDQYSQVKGKPRYRKCYNCADTRTREERLIDAGWAICDCGAAHNPEYDTCSECSEYY